MQQHSWEHENLMPTPEKQRLLATGSMSERQITKYSYQSEAKICDTARSVLIRPRSDLTVRAGHEQTQSCLQHISCQTNHSFSQLLYQVKQESRLKSWWLMSGSMSGSEITVDSMTEEWVQNSPIEDHTCNCKPWQSFIKISWFREKYVSRAHSGCQDIV